MGKVIDKLEAGKTYRLIDKRGYLNSNWANTIIYKKYFENDLVKIEDVAELGNGMIPFDTIILNHEIRFFELFDEEEEEPYLWDGKETLEVGMKLTVKNSFDTPMVLQKIIPCNNDNEDQHLLAEENSNVHHLFLKEDLRPLVKDPKEEFQKLILDKVRGSHPDFAQDTTFDIKEIAAMCYDELKGGSGGEVQRVCLQLYRK